MEKSSGPNVAEKSNGFFRVPGLFVRLNSKALMDTTDSVWSPTSPLDFKPLPYPGNTNVRSQTLQGVDVNPRNAAPKVGLGLLDALTDQSLRFGGKNMYLGSELKIHESIRPFLQLGQPQTSMSMPVSEVMQSEEYTCIVAHGPNPRTVHVFGEEKLQIHENVGPSPGEDGGGSMWFLGALVEPETMSAPLDVRGFCCYCKKKLGEDCSVFIYMGEKAFCSKNCRAFYIEEEEMEATEYMVLDS